MDRGEEEEKQALPKERDLEDDEDEVDAGGDDGKAADPPNWRHGEIGDRDD